MNRLIVRNRWSQLKTLLKQDLAGLTDADLAACHGRRDKLIEKFQEIYGIPVDEAEGALMHYERQLAVWYSPSPSRAAAAVNI